MMKYKVVFTITNANNEGDQYILRQEVLKHSKLSEAELSKLKIYNVICNDVTEQCFLLKDVEKLENENIKEVSEEKDNIEDKLIIINDDITQNKCDKIIKDFIKFEEDIDKIDYNNKPKLILRISSYGGDVHVANNIISYMEYLKSKGVFIITIACGFANSSGMLIFMHGNKRIFLNKEYTMLLWHQCKLGSVKKTLNNYVRYLNSVDRTWNIHEKYLIENTKVTREMLDDLRDEDWYIYYDEALELGIVTE